MRKVAVPPLLLFIASWALLVACDTVSARMEIQKANSYYKKEDFQSALVHYQTALKIDPTLTQVWRSVGLSAMTLYRPGQDNKDNNKLADTAIDALQKYIAAFPEDVKAQEYLLSIYQNSGRHDELLKVLMGKVKKDPKDLKTQTAIVRIYLTTKRIQEAYDYVINNIPDADPEPYQFIASYCWDKSYRDASLTPEQRVPFIEMGLKSSLKALEMQAKLPSGEDYPTLIYTNLLYREKAKVQNDLKSRDEFNDKAEEYKKKAEAVREKLRAAQASGK
jgi:tetratricopeptide (TPR) repeat protein